MRKQISEIIALLGKEFLYKNWPELIPGLFGILDAQPDSDMVMFVYETFKRICKKYRTQFRSDDLYREINYMVESLFARIVATLK